MDSDTNTGDMADCATGKAQPSAATSRFIEVDGLRLHYLDHGTEGRPTMLCIHGSGAHAHWFDFAAQDLKSDYHVLSLDLRGHGDSEWAIPPVYSYVSFASDLTQVVETLDLRDFVLVAHSVGGRIALGYAATHPGRAGKLILADSSFHMSQDRVTALRKIGTQPSRSYTTREELIARYRLLPEGSTAAPEVIHHVAEHSGRQFDDGLWRHKLDRGVYLAREAEDALPYWSHIDIPSLVVKGGNSNRITGKIFAQIKARAPLAELAVVPDSDHHVMLDNPSGFASAVKDFLARHGHS